MKLTVLGCGPVPPDPERVCSGYFIDTGAVRILFDCGPGVVHRMARFHADWQHITHLAITHFHNDHIGDIGMLFFAWKYGMQHAQRTEPLIVLGPEGMKDRLAKIGDAFGPHVREPDFDVEVHEFAQDGRYTVAGDMQISTERTVHTTNSIAFRLDAADGVFGYTGDTGPSPVLGEFFAGADLLVAECSVPDEEAMENHLSPASIADLATQARPRTLVLTHVYPQNHARLQERVRDAGWAGDTVVAYDGLSLDVRHA